MPRATAFDFTADPHDADPIIHGASLERFRSMHTQFVQDVSAKEQERRWIGIAGRAAEDDRPQEIVSLEKDGISPDTSGGVKSSYR